MTAKRTAKDGLGLLGFGAAACLACCAGPILAFLGGLSVAGVASTWLIGSAGLVVAAVAAAALVVVRRRRRRSACDVPAGDVPVQLLTKSER